MEHKAILGTSLATMVPSAAVGSYYYYTHGNLRVGLVLPLAIGSFIGASFGGNNIARRLDEDVMRNVYIVLLVVLGSLSVRNGRRMVVAVAVSKGKGKVQR